MAESVGVVFSQGGKVYSFDPNGLELRWDEHVICQTLSRPRRTGAWCRPSRRARRRRRPAAAQGAAPRDGARRRDAAAPQPRGRGARPCAPSATRCGDGAPRCEPLAAEVVFDGSRVVLSYRADEPHRAQAPDRRPGAASSAGASSCGRSTRGRARACAARAGCAANRKCCNRFPSHEQPITLRMASRARTCP